MPLKHVNICVQINGKEYSRTVETNLLLSDFIRHEIHLTGTHVGCEHGVCGACTILCNNQPIRSCLMLAVQSNGLHLETIESLADEGNFHPLQEAFSEKHGLQCGYCTPGILMTLKAFLTANPEASENEIRVALSGNLCRCTGYQQIIEAAIHAAAIMREKL